MHKRLMKFLDSSKILFRSQFGFRSNHSTEKPLCYCIEKIFKTFESGKFGSAIFIDLVRMLLPVAQLKIRHLTTNQGIPGSCPGRIGRKLL